MTPACNGTPTIIFVSAPSCINQIVRIRNSTEDHCGTYNAKLYVQAPKEKACFNTRLYDSPFELKHFFVKWRLNTGSRTGINRSQESIRR